LTQARPPSGFRYSQGGRFETMTKGPTLTFSLSRLTVGGQKQGRGPDLLPRRHPWERYGYRFPRRIECRFQGHSSKILRKG